MGEVIDDSDMILWNSMVVDNKWVVIEASISRNTKSIINALDTAKCNGAKTVLLTARSLENRDFCDEFLQVDLNRILDKIAPRVLSKNTNYRYPGPNHLEFLNNLDDSNYPTDPATILNGDAHIRSSFFGASESFILHEGQLEIGSVGYIFFVDFDQNRIRNLTCHLMLIGE